MKTSIAPAKKQIPGEGYGMNRNLPDLNQKSD